MIVDPERVAAAIAEIAEEEIMSRFGQLADRDVATKSGPQDFVTAADHAAEASLEKALRAFHPGAAFIGEESVAADPERIMRLDRETGAFWIVDPLDGTRNFVEGRREFGVIVALVENGETRQGWIYAAPDHAFAIASKGDGATWQGARVRASAASAQPLTGYRAIGTLAPPWKEIIPPRLRRAFETAPMRCSAYGYIDFLRGKRDFGVFSRCSPWDHAAGALMVGETGGCAAYMDDLSPYAPRMTRGRPLLVASRGADWPNIFNALTGKSPPLAVR